MVRSRIIGTGSYIPELVLDNRTLETLVDTTDEWILQRTGIRERRIAAGLHTWEMAFSAGQKALEDAGISAGALDYIIVSTVTPDNYTPTVSCMVQGKLGADNASAVDINAACSGFVYAADMADSYIRAGKAKNILVISAEILSRIIDYTDRSTCVIFGDGAGAAVFTAHEGEEGILSTFLAANGTMGEALLAGAFPAEKDPLRGDRSFDQNRRFLKMAGNDVFRFTAAAVPEAIDRVLDDAGLGAEEIDWFVLHQANKRIIQMVIKRYGLTEEKVYINIDRFGNTSSASIPLCLDEMRKAGMLKAGQKAVMVGFGGGLTYGALVVTI